MRFLTYTLILLFCIGAFSTSLSGQNSDAEFRIDLSYYVEGNQNQTSQDAPGAIGVPIHIDLYVENCSNLDAYEFAIWFNPDHLQFVQFSKNKRIYIPPLYDITETNILLKHVPDGTFSESGDSSPGYRSFGITLNGAQTDALAPDGNGFLGTLDFETKVEAPQSVLFSSVVFTDNNAQKDPCLAPRYDPEALLGGGSLPVELQSFKAQNREGKIIISWNTESETNTWGYNVLRSREKNEKYEQINSSFIPAAGNSTTQKSYSFVDDRVENGVTYFYKLQQIDIDGKIRLFGPISIKAENLNSLPNEFVLYQNFPNPFNSETTIKFELPSDELVTIEIFNIAGAKIKTLVRKPFVKGVYTIDWDGTNDSGEIVTSGSYIYKFNAGQIFKIRNMVLLK